MVNGALFAMQTKLNTELKDYDHMARGEKAALRQAKKAETAFRASKGYEPDSVWYRLKKHFFKS